MSAIERRSDPTSLALRALADRECARFRRRNLRQPGPGRRVHAVELRAFTGGLHLPSPACHQPVDGFALSGHAAAVTVPVDCARCLALPATYQARLVVLDGGQLPLGLRLDEDND